MNFYIFCSDLKCCQKLYVFDVRHIVIILYSPMSCYQLHNGGCTNLVRVLLHTGDCKNLCAVVSWFGLERNVGSIYDSGRPAVGLKLKSVPRKIISC